MPDSGFLVPKTMPYLPQLDGVRALAILIVFAAHCGYSHVVPGGFGVTVFFFLSGYLITTLLRIERAQTGAVSLPAFYLRRSAPVTRSRKRPPFRMRSASVRPWPCAMARRSDSTCVITI